MESIDGALENLYKSIIRACKSRTMPKRGDFSNQENSKASLSNSLVRPTKLLGVVQDRWGLLFSVDINPSFDPQDCL